MLTKSVLNGKEINLTSDDINIQSDTLSIDKYGNMVLKGDETNPNIKIVSKDTDNRYITINPARLLLSFNNRNMLLYNNPSNLSFRLTWGSYVGRMTVGDGFCRVVLDDGINQTQIDSYGITTPTLTQTSLAEQKKNFEKMQDNALDIINSIDIYKYNLKGEEDTDKKHLGFVIGKGYNYSEEVTNNDNTGVDNYSFTSLCCKAIQEQQAIIEQLKKEIEELKEERK